MTEDRPDPGDGAPQQPPPPGPPSYGPPSYGPPSYGPPSYPPSYGPPSYEPQPYGVSAYGSPPSPPPPRRSTWPWLVGIIALAGILVLGGASFAVWSAWSGRTGTRAQATAPAPAPTTAPGSASPEPSDSGAAETSPSTSPSGGTSSPSGSGGVATAKDAWLASTNAYCRNTTDPAIKKASPLSSTDLAAYFRRIAAINRDLDVVLRKAPPSSLRTQVEQVATNWDRMATLFDQAATALAANDRQGAARLATQGDAANQAGNDLATRIGLQDCAQAGAIGGTASASAPIV